MCALAQVHVPKMRAVSVFSARCSPEAGVGRLRAVRVVDLATLIGQVERVPADAQAGTARQHSMVRYLHRKHSMRPVATIRFQQT